MSPILEAAARLRASLPEKKPPPPPAPPAPTNGAAGSTSPGPQAAGPSGAPSSFAAPAPPAAPQNAEGAADFLLKVGNGLTGTAALLRRANPADPAPYRLARVGIWLHLAQPPPSNANRTSIPPPPAALRTQLERMSENAKWAEVIEESESALATQRFWLDLHRFTHRALRELGDGHARARKALATELGSALRRFDGILQLTFNDGTPLADGQTASWIADEVLSAADGAASAAGPRGRRPKTGRRRSTRRSAPWSRPGRSRTPSPGWTPRARERRAGASVSWRG
jgi:type VI secretion system protein VasJ